MSSDFDLDDLLAPDADQTKAGVGRGKKATGGLRRPDVSSSDVQSAKGRYVVAGRVSKTVRLSPELVELIDTEAKAPAGHKPVGDAVGCGVFDLYELLLRYAWAEYAAGKIPIVVEEERIIRRKVSVDTR